MSRGKRHTESKMVVYVPFGAELNLENKSQEPPIPKYNHRKKNFNKDAVKKIVGGAYARNG